MYNPHPEQPTQQTEGKKTKFDAAEYDGTFLERVMNVDYEEMQALLHSLPEEQRKAIIQAINAAIGQQVIQDHHQWLSMGT